MALSHTFVLNLKLERLCLAKKTLKDCGSYTKPRVSPKGFPSNSFCISNNIPYTAFYDWFKKAQKKVVPVEVEGIPEELIRTGNEERQDVAKDKSKRTTPHKGSIMVTIKTREGLCIQKKGLDYQGLKTLVEKLEGLC